ncbi:MAG: PfkB family carbohydrate kinase [Candidatus Brocadiia bacterium]
MIRLVVVGSVAYDAIETPYGTRDRALGGSASYFSYAASFFTKVGLVGIVGKDFDNHLLDPHVARGIDLTGLVRDEKRDSFFWRGRYEGDMNSAQTLEVRLNVLGDFKPQLPASYRSAPFLFLANSHPASQASALSQMKGKVFSCADSMNLWISNELGALRELLRRVDGFFCNDGEARMLSGNANLIYSGRRIMELGPRFITMKKGEHGAILFSHDGLVGIPGFPVEKVVDPTGAGDSFAGGFMGSLARSGKSDLPALKDALVDGTAMASFAVEGFGLERFYTLTEKDIEERRSRIIEYMPGAR